jgi:hypothetical protein
VSAFLPSPDDDLFPSGEWTGFYIQNRRQYRQDLVLTFANGRMRGSGGDSIGAFAIRGRYDAVTLEVTWTKTYLGAHSVHYRGFREGKGIWGTWEIRSSFRGGFHIWPRRAGEFTEAAAASEEVVALPATANGARNAARQGG